MKQNVEITTAQIQLNQLLKWIGLLQTGGQVSYLLAENNIMLNGKNVYEKRKKVFPGDTVTVNGVEYFIVQTDTVNNEC